MYKYIVIFLLYMVNIANAEPIAVSIFNGKNVGIIEIQPQNSNYNIFGDDKLFPEIPINSILQLVADEDSIIFFANSVKISKYKKIYFSNNGGCTFKLKSTQPNIDFDLYDGDLEFTNSYCFIKTINNLEIEDYIAGVVEAEAGTRLPIEYFKVQSIICRTYVLGHLKRHELEGFNVCDKEHCQVYKGKSYANNDIQKAALLTEGIVLVNNNLELITCAFHSNCGGQTANAEDVWNRPSFGLKSTRDTFCLRQRNASWEKEIKKSDWIKYLIKKRKDLDSATISSQINFNQNDRKIFLEIDNVKIPLKEIRLDLGLKSTFFSVYDKGEKVLLKGKGFGHGIGLCQEGAIQMAKQGISQFDILHYYYKDVILMNRAKIFFFKDE